jgi:hypothetical protein
MNVLGTVMNGVVILDNGHHIPEGTRVEVTIKPSSKAASPLGEILLRHAGRATGLPEDLAEQHDHYLHGKPKR